MYDLVCEAEGSATTVPRCHEGAWEHACDGEAIVPNIHYDVILVLLRVQVPNNYILTQNLYYNYYYSKPKYLIIGYLDPLGSWYSIS